MPSKTTIILTTYFCVKMKEGGNMVLPVVAIVGSSKRWKVYNF